MLSAETWASAMLSIVTFKPLVLAAFEACSAKASLLPDSVPYKTVTGAEAPAVAVLAGVAIAAAAFG